MPSGRGEPARKKWRDQMIRSVCAMLDAELDAAFLEHQSSANSKANVSEFITYIGSPRASLDQAERGNFEPLRALLPPGSDKYVSFRKPGRGRRPKPRTSDIVDAAIADVKRIRAIWNERYGHWKRPKDDLLHAEDIAVWRWRDITDDRDQPVVTKKSIERRMKPSGQSGRHKKKQCRVSRAK